MVKKNTKFDPISARYFSPLEKVENIGIWSFKISSVFSVLILFVNSETDPDIYNVIQVFFILSVLSLVISNLCSRLYFAPRAQRKRYEDFLCNAYQKDSNKDKTFNYYTVEAEGLAKRLAGQLLENSYYSEDTVSEMTKRERGKILVYAIVWIGVILWRDANLGFIAIITQIFFSEQIISRWLRIEWLRNEFEKVFERMYRHMNNKEGIDFVTQEELLRYETAKANAGITLSSKIFNDRQSVTDAEWVKIKDKLSI